MQATRESDNVKINIFEKYSPLQKYQQLKALLSNHIEKLSFSMQRKKQILNIKKLKQIYQGNLVQKASVRVSLLLASPIVYFNLLKSSPNQQLTSYKEANINNNSLRNNEQENFMKDQQNKVTQINVQKIIINNSVKLFSNSLVSQEKVVNAQRQKRKTEEKKTKKLKTAFDILPHLILAGLVFKGMKNIRNPKKYYQIIIGSYFWAITYPWAYFCYKGVVQYYVVPKMMNSQIMKSFHIECKEQNSMISMNMQL